MTKEEVRARALIEVQILVVIDWSRAHTHDYKVLRARCFVLKDRYDKVERYPLFENEIGEVVLRSGNMVSTGALASLGFWDVDVLVTTRALLFLSASRIRIPRLQRP